MEIVKIISEWKKVKKPQVPSIGFTYPAQGMKRVEAIVRTESGLQTRHIDIPRN